MPDEPVWFYPYRLPGRGDGGYPLVEGDQGLGFHLEEAGITRVERQRMVPPEKFWVK